MARIKQVASKAKAYGGGVVAAIAAGDEDRSSDGVDVDDGDNGGGE